MEYEAEKAEENGSDTDETLEAPNKKRKSEGEVGKVVSTKIFSILGGLLTSQNMIKCIHQVRSLNNNPSKFIRASGTGEVTGKRSIQKLNIFRMVTSI